MRIFVDAMNEPTAAETSAFKARQKGLNQARGLRSGYVQTGPSSQTITVSLSREELDVVARHLSKKAWHAVFLLKDFSDDPTGLKIMLQQVIVDCERAEYLRGRLE